MNFKITDLLPELITEILYLCDYKSIILSSLTCKTINNLNSDKVILEKSKLYVKDEPTIHLINIDRIIKNISRDDHNKITIINFLLDNNMDFKCNDEIIFVPLIVKNKDINYLSITTSFGDLNITNYENFKIAIYKNILCYINPDKDSQLFPYIISYYLNNKEWLLLNIKENFIIFDKILKFY